MGHIVGYIPYYKGIYMGFFSWFIGEKLILPKGVEKIEKDP
jgi:hypothetical protein